MTVFAAVAQEVLSLGSASGASSVLKRALEDVETCRIINLVETYRFRSVKVEQNFFVHRVVVAGFVPVWVNHDDVAARLEHEFLVEKRERKAAPVATINELALVCHQN